MSDLKARLRHVNPVNGRIRYSTYFSGGHEFYRAISVLPESAPEGVLVNPDGPEAADRIAALEEKLRVAREFCRAVSEGYANPDINHEAFRVQVHIWAEDTLQSIGDEDE